MNVEDTSQELITANQTALNKRQSCDTQTDSTMNIHNTKTNFAPYTVKCEKLLSSTGEQIEMFIRTRNFCIVNAIKRITQDDTSWMILHDLLIMQKLAECWLI